MAQKPKTIDEYKSWASANYGHEFDKSCATWYGAATQNLMQTLQGSFLAELQREIEAAGAAYLAEVGSDLFLTPDAPALHWRAKTFDSMIDKLYRANVLWNGQWPKPPAWEEWVEDPGDRSWIGPYDCLKRLDDVIRTRVVCKYIDGPTFLAARIEELARNSGVGCKVGSRELDAGYYSHHIYFDIVGDNIGRNFETIKTRNRIELQVTTQLQDVLMSLTHRFYERDRLKLSRREKPWRWDYNTAQFKGAYLGHTLHLLEAIVIEVRDEIGRNE